MNVTPPYLSRITARTLIVHGDRDPFYPTTIPLELYTAIPRSSFWIIPNGGHGPIFSDMTHRFVETALAFLRGEWEREWRHSLAVATIDLRSASPVNPRHVLPV